MGHLCGSICKRKRGIACKTCRTSGGASVALLDANGKPVKPPMAGNYRLATPREKGATVDMYFDGLSYRWTAEDVGQYFGRETTQVNVYGWVRDLSKSADEILRTMNVTTGDEWVADEVAVKVGGRNYWLFNLMDSETRFLLAAYLSPVQTSRAAGRGNGVGVGAGKGGKCAAGNQDGRVGVISGCLAAGIPYPPG